jgi:hypothetical protein
MSYYDIINIQLYEHERYLNECMCVLVYVLKWSGICMEMVFDIT